MQITPTSIRLEPGLAKRLKAAAKVTGFKEADLIRCAVSDLLRKTPSQIIALAIDIRSSGSVVRKLADGDTSKGTIQNMHVRDNVNKRTGGPAKRAAVTGV